MSQYKQFIAISASLMLLLPVISVNADRLISLDRINLSIITDKRIYYPGEIATYIVKFTDSQGNPIDPDLIRATYDSKFIELDRIGEGIYTHSTGMLTQKDHQLGVYAEKSGYNFVQQSLTIRPIATQKASDNVEMTAVQQGNVLKVRISNDILSQNEIYKVRFITIDSSVENVLSSSWMKVPNHIGIDLKSVVGSVGSGQKQTIKLIVDGDASMIVWNAYDKYGKQIYAGADKVVR